MDSIAYKAGYKYRLHEAYQVQINIYPVSDVELGPIRLTRNGMLTIGRYYAWDGPSGPTIDTKNFMRGSLVHDAIYELLRWNLLPYKHRETADQELRRLCIEDGMSRIRAWWVYKGVRFGGRSSTMPSGRKRIYYAP